VRIFSSKHLLQTLALGLSFGFIPVALAQLSITNNTNAQQLANALAGPGVTVVAGSATLSRATTNQNNTGTFTGGSSGGAGPVVGIGSGVVLTTGNFATSVLGPNNRKNSTVSGGQLSDSDLSALAGSNARFDTVVLQFNVIPSGRSLNFQFVFGSEEYPEYVCSNFNDAIGLFVSGPGLSGPFSNGAVNLAVLPNNSRVSINTVNGGVVGFQAGAPAAGCDLGNAAYYVDNGDPNNSSLPNPILFTNTQLDGFTRPLPSRAVVVPGQTYRVKIAIADAGDGSLDSAVFLRAISSQSDWGDAPDTYGTTATSNGAHHDLDNRIFIGSIPPDADPNGQPGTPASGDDLTGINDENTFAALPTLTSSSSSYTLNNIPLSNTTGLPAVLAGWLDFNRNGQFDAGERTTASIPSGTTSASLQWTGLSGLSTGPTYLRLRLSSDLGFIGNPQPRDGANNGEVEDYVINIVFAAIVSGTVYHDLQPNTTLDAENWTGGPTVFVNLVQGASVLRSAQISSGGGGFSFSEVLVGGYTLVLTNSATATTPTAPTGWLFSNPDPGLRSLTVSSHNIASQDFGLFNGSRIRGTVFRDDGLGAGTANDALQNGGEPGIPNILVTASDGTSSRSTSTDASGLYAVFIPASFGSNLTLSHPQQPATGSNIGGANIILATTYGATAAARRTISSFAAGQRYEGYNFGLVRQSHLSPDQSGQSPSPGTLTYSHLYRPGSLGSVNLAISGGYTYLLRRDVNCDGDFADAGEGFLSLPHSFEVDATWPRESDGGLRACTLEVQVLVPAGLPGGRVDIAGLQASLSWANNTTISDVRQVFDTTTVVAAGGLQLFKEVRNFSRAGSFAAAASGQPGEILEYRIAYQNIGSQPIFNVVLADPIPFFTSLVQNAYSTGEVELACPNGGLVRPDLGSVGNITLNLASLCSLSTAPNPNGSGTLPALLPAQGGYFLYRVQVR